MKENKKFFLSRNFAENNNERLILISILSYYCRQIFNGTKMFEFRKSPIPVSALNKQMFVYSAKDDKAVIGSFKVKRIHEGNIEQILKITGYKERADGQEIVKYFKNCLRCYALELYDIHIFKKALSLKRMRTLDPKIQMPQYYTYINKNSPIYYELKTLS